LRSGATTRALALLLAATAAVVRGAAAEPGAAALPRPFHVIAHRGASAQAPENTLPAFERALALGIVEVELDVQLSRDGVPVLFHDSTLDEKTSLRGRVSEHAASALRQAEIGAWFDRTHPASRERWQGTRLATLREAFDAFGERLHYHVEIKDENPATPERILEAVAAAGLASRVTLTSFSRAQLERAQRRAPAVPACWLLERAAPEAIDAAAQAGFAMLGVRASEITPELVRLAHARGLEIRAFGVGRDDALMERAARTGCNGMTLDRPERLVAWILERLRVQE
jgi:glycerophosphoryl diester phosphodiesterase